MTRLLLARIERADSEDDAPRNYLEVPGFVFERSIWRPATLVGVLLIPIVGKAAVGCTLLLIAGRMFVTAVGALFNNWKPDWIQKNFEDPLFPWSIRMAMKIPVLGATIRSAAKIAFAVIGKEVPEILRKTAAIPAQVKQHIEEQPKRELEGRYVAEGRHVDLMKNGKYEEALEYGLKYKKDSYNTRDRILKDIVLKLFSDEKITAIGTINENQGAQVRERRYGLEYELQIAEIAARNIRDTQKRNELLQRLFKARLAFAGQGLTEVGQAKKYDAALKTIKMVKGPLGDRVPGQMRDSMRLELITTIFSEDHIKGIMHTGQDALTLDELKDFREYLKFTLEIARNINDTASRDTALVRLVRVDAAYTHRVLQSNFEIAGRKGASLHKRQLEYIDEKFQMIEDIVMLITNPEKRRELLTKIGETRKLVQSKLENLKNEQKEKREPQISILPEPLPIAAE